MRGVNRVEIAGSTGESGHLVRSDDLHTTQQTARSAFDFGFDSTIVGRFRRSASEYARPRMAKRSVSLASSVPS